MGLCISPCVGMRPLVGKGVKEYDIHFELKSCKFKILEKLVVQHIVGQVVVVAPLKIIFKIG